MLVALIFCTLIFPYNSNHCNDPNEKYVSKAKRSMKSKIFNSARKWMKNSYGKLIDAFDDWSVQNPTRVIRKRQLIAIRMRTHTRRRVNIATPIMVAAAVAMQAQGAIGTHASRRINFDTDSEEIGIDNRCSACISHKIEDFICLLYTSPSPRDS